MTTRGCVVMLAVKIEPGETWDTSDSPITLDNAGNAVKQALDGALRLLNLADVLTTITVARVKPLLED